MHLFVYLWVKKKTTEKEAKSPSLSNLEYHITADTQKHLCKEREQNVLLAFSTNSKIKN